MASSAQPIVNYEVYVLEGQRWILHARYSKGERELAVRDAQAVEKQLYCSVRVVRDTYDPEANTSSEVTVYLTNKQAAQAVAFAPRKATRPRAPNRTPQERVVKFEAPNASKRPKAKSGLSLLVQMGGVVITAIVVAAMATGAISPFLGDLDMFGIHITPPNYPKFLFLVFVVSFLVTAIPLVVMLLQDDAPAPAPRPEPVRPPPPAPPKQKPLIDPEDELPAKPSLLEELFAPIEEAAAPPEPPPAPEPEPEPPQEPEPQPETKPDPDLPVAQTATAEEPEYERQKMGMMKFLGGALAAIKEKRPQLDAYNRFGLNLMLAGGMDVLGERNDIAAPIRRQLLQDTMEVLGTRRSMAETFADRYEEYMLEPRYLLMVQTGREAMERFIRGDTGAFSGANNAFEVWNKPTEQAGKRIMTVFFTDMVGSTDMTQALGDQAAQEVVRRHNSIVRSALAEFGGKEIKHTGDGIMASFTSTAAGVEACIAIQRAVMAHNAARPDLPLHLRIGINAGEPIEEEDDLFGSTVQLAARVCAKAQSDEILVTNVVRELSSGTKTLRFTGAGNAELKGFKEPVALFAVEWKETSTAAPATVA